MHVSRVYCRKLIRCSHKRAANARLSGRVACIRHDNELRLRVRVVKIPRADHWTDHIVSALNNDGRDMVQFVCVAQQLAFLNKCTMEEIVGPSKIQKNQKRRMYDSTHSLNARKCKSEFLILVMFHKICTWQQLARAPLPQCPFADGSAPNHNYSSAESTALCSANAIPNGLIARCDA